MPKVSVILPTYNRAHLVNRAIQSVLAQSYKDFELIIIDDGSTDNTEEIIKIFDDTRIRYVRYNENKGAAAARNIGIRLALGEFIAFQDSDDEWLSDKLKKQMDIFEKLPSEVGIIYSSAWRISDTKKELENTNTIMPEDGIIYKEAINRVRPACPSSILRREVFDKVGMFDENFLRWEDRDFFIRVSKYYLFYHLDEPLLNIYRTPGSLSWKRKNLVLARKLFLDKYYGDFEKKRNRKLLCEYQYSIGHDFCQKGEMLEGIKYFIQVIKNCPWHAKALTAIPATLFGKKIYNKLHPI